MRNTYWFAVDYNGTGHLFTCPPERDTGMWTGEEALYIPTQTIFVLYKALYINM